MVRRWRQAFQQRGAGVKASQRAPADRAKPQGYEPGESPDDLKKRIGELTAQNELLKKSLGLLGKWADSTKWNWLECCVLRTGKNRIRHVGHKYGIAARGKRKK